MAAIENYIAALESAVKEGNSDKILKAKQTLWKFVYNNFTPKKGSVCGHGMTTDTQDLNGDKVNGPLHYQSMEGDLNIDCITAMQAAFGKYETAVFCKLNAFKYVWRASSKNGNEDIDKASWYLKKYRELGGENQ